ncbi:MAG: hypothetical protein ACYSYT_04520 [Planctomycetota bacterium]
MPNSGRKSSKAIWLAVICIILAHTARAHAATKTIATFGDPAVDGTTPLFEINLTSNTITGGWDDSQTGLDLDVVYSGHMFHDAELSSSGATEKAAAPLP